MRHDNGRFHGYRPGNNPRLMQRKLKKIAQPKVKARPRKDKPTK